MEATATGQGPKCFKPATPLKFPAWESALMDHPDKRFVDYILSGIRRGVHIGVVRAHPLCSARDGNLPSVQSLPSLVTQHIQDERLAGRLLGPLPQPLVSDCQISPIGLIPNLTSQAGGALSWTCPRLMGGVSMMQSHLTSATCTIRLFWRHQQLSVSWAEEQVSQD